MISSNSKTLQTLMTLCDNSHEFCSFAVVKKTWRRQAFWPFYFFFLRLHLQHMEVPRLSVELELQLPAHATATTMPDLSLICDLCCSLHQCRFLAYWMRPGIKLSSSWILVRLLTHWATEGTPQAFWLWWALLLSKKLVYSHKKVAMALPNLGHAKILA